MKHHETLLAHAGTEPDPETGAIAPPIHLATNFEAAPDGTFDRYKYGRHANPTRDRFEKTLAELEGADSCIAFSSGMAAAAAVMEALMPGDRILLSEDLYHGVSQYADLHFTRRGGVVDRVAATDTGAIAGMMSDGTRLVWIETPSNPNLFVTDIRAAADAAHAAGALLLCDSTFSTPLITRPFELGADIVIHSSTKYLGGHSDALGGAVLFREPSGPTEQVRSIQTLGGAVMDPFTAWLTLRGMRSLGARMRMICDTAPRVAAWLEARDDVTTVNYPGLPTHPGHDTARRQMAEFGGMLSFRVSGGAARALRIVGKASVFTRATSLGGTESLIEHRRSSEGPQSTTPEDLIRLSIGLEHPDDLLDDLGRAFDA